MSVGAFLGNGLSLLLIAIAFFIGRWWESEVSRRRELEVKLADSRQQLYRKFMHEIWGKATQGALTEKDIQEVMRPWSFDMFLVASDEVIQKYLALLAGSNLKTGSDLLKAMRRDMGNPNTTITQKQVLQTFIKPSDWSEIDALLAAPIVPSEAPRTAAESAAAPQESSASDAGKPLSD